MQKKSSRQFSHRVKGVSLATFKPEEVAALEQSGNALVLGTYLARWSPSDLPPRPTGREPARIADWVEAVFVKKRFYAEPDIGSGRVSLFYFIYLEKERGGVWGKSPFRSASDHCVCSFSSRRDDQKEAASFCLFVSFLFAYLFLFFLLICFFGFKI